MISIIGAGPSGNYLAYLLAKEGKEVEVYEEHDVIGRPIQCTGIVTKAFSEIIELQSDFVENITSRAEVTSPEGKSFVFPLRDNIVVCRHKFDSHLAKMAAKAGAKYYLKSRFLKHREKDSKIEFDVNINGEVVKKVTDVLVGADGPHSRVAKSAGLLIGRRYLNALQVKAKYKMDKEMFKVQFHRDYFGWVVPENEEVARIGITGFRKPKEYFDDFMKQFIKEEDILEFQSGLVPVYDPKNKIKKGNVYLLGDAAALTKASTHGGIIQGLIAAEELKKAIIEGKDYQKLVRKRLGKDLCLHLFLRETMESFSDRDVEYLVKLTGQDKIKKILSNFDRDYPTRFLLRIFMIEPRYFYFTKNLNIKALGSFIKGVL
jgi:digeranylgeranylglycerophospholipid reductase